MQTPEDWLKTTSEPLVESLRENLSDHFIYPMINKYCETINKIEQHHGRYDGSEWCRFFYHVGCTQLFDAYQIKQFQEGWLYLGELRGLLKALTGEGAESGVEHYFSENPEELSPCFNDFLGHVRQFMSDMIKSEQKTLLN